MSEEDEDLAIQAALEFSEAEPLQVTTPLQIRKEAKKVKTVAASFLLAWKTSKEQLYIEGRVPWGRLPKFVEQYLRLLWDTNEYWALRSMVIGDVSFFIAWLFKIDQIDNAMIDAGMGLADRAPLIRFRAALDGYREVAEKRLKKLGGRWPPSLSSGRSEEAR